MHVVLREYTRLTEKKQPLLTGVFTTPLVQVGIGTPFIPHIILQDTYWLTTIMVPMMSFLEDLIGYSQVG